MVAAPSGRRLAILTGCLAVITALSALWPIYRAFLRIEIDINEGWVANFADAALARRPLYPSRERLIANNYPPLSFYLVGALGWCLHDMVLAGRLLSLASVAVCATAVVVAGRRLGGSAAAAGIGALYFTATMCRFFGDYVGMNDPQLLAQAVMVVGFLIFLRARERDRGYWRAILIMVVAGFIKHNVVVMPLTAMLWLGLHRPRQMVGCGLLAAGALAAGFALCYAVYGPDFFANLFCPRALLWKHSLGAVGHLQFIVVGLLAWLYTGITRRADPQIRLLNLLIVLGVVLFFVQKAGEGVASNAQFELVFGVSIGVGLAFTHAPALPLARRYSPVALRVALLCAVCLRLLVLPRCEMLRLLVDPEFRAEITEREAAMAATIEGIKATRGDVSSCLVACYWAGKPLVVDQFTLGERVRAGKLPGDAVDRLIASGRLTRVGQQPLANWHVPRGLLDARSGKP